MELIRKSYANRDWLEVREVSKEGKNSMEKRNEMMLVS